eukprot:gene7829-664_t
MLGISEVLFLCGTGMVIIGSLTVSFSVLQPSFQDLTLLSLQIRSGSVPPWLPTFRLRGREDHRPLCKQHQLGDIHKQLREGLDDVNAIREEWLRLTNRQAIQSALLGHHRNDSSHQGSKQSETEATLSPPKQDIDAKDSQISYLNTARTTTTHPSESLVTVSARTVRSQQQAVAGSDYLNVAIASQRLGRARQHPHQS